MDLLLDDKTRWGQWLMLPFTGCPAHSTFLWDYATGQLRRADYAEIESEPRMIWVKPGQVALGSPEPELGRTVDEAPRTQ